MFPCPHCGKFIAISKATTAQPKATPREPSEEADVSGLGDLLDSINVDTIGVKEAEFVNNCRERYAQYGERTRMTEKQMAWLNRIADAEF